MCLKKTIFKYVDLEGLESILTNSTLKFTHPQNFNDPFEFHSNLVDRKLSANHQLEILKKHGEVLTREEIEKYKRQVRLNKGGFDNDHLIELFEQRKQETYVTCFSEVSDNLLMWSHYADKHKGACIGFKTKALQSDYKSDSYFSNVKYYRKIITKNLSRSREAAIAHWACSKGKNWQYEKEVRIILGSRDSEFVPFNLLSIEEIIFGCLVSEVKKKNLENLIFNLKELSWIVTSEMNMSNKEFKLEKNKRN